MDTTANKPVTSYTTYQKSDRVWNILTFLVLFGTIGMVGLFAVIYLDPNNRLNPFPPPSVPASVMLPGVTSTSVFPPTWTPEANQSPLPTNTPQPPQPTGTQSVLPTVPTLAVTPFVETPLPDTLPAKVYFPFELRGQIASVASTIIHPDENCAWMGIGGQVFDIQGASLVGMTIQVGGTLNEKAVNLLSLTGTARQYGEAGYEFYLGAQPVGSRSSLWMQVLDQAGLALSEKVYFDTYEDCEKNLVLINFRQVR